MDVLGLRSKRFLNDILQFEGNFNLGRGIIWLILSGHNFIKVYSADGSDDVYGKPLYVSFLVASRFAEDWFKISFIVSFLIQGFVSIPLTLHFSKFSISISLDSLIWGVAGFFLDNKEQGYVDIDALVGESVLENNKYQSITYTQN